MASLGNGIHCKERQWSIDAVIHAVQLGTGQGIAGILPASTLDLLDYREAHFSCHPSMSLPPPSLISFTIYLTAGLSASFFELLWHRQASIAYGTVTLPFKWPSLCTQLGSLSQQILASQCPPSAEWAFLSLPCASHLNRNSFSD